MAERVDKVDGYLMLGINGKGEVVVNHPSLITDEHGAGHIVFSPNQARNMARIMFRKAMEIDGRLDLDKALEILKDVAMSVRNYEGDNDVARNAVAAYYLIREAVGAPIIKPPDRTGHIELVLPINDPLHKSLHDAHIGREVCELKDWGIVFHIVAMTAEPHWDDQVKLEMDVRLVKDGE